MGSESEVSETETWTKATWWLDGLQLWGDPGPLATDWRLRAQLNKTFIIRPKMMKYSTCCAFLPGWAYTATRAIEAVHSWCFLWMCLYILRIGKKVFGQLETNERNWCESINFIVWKVIIACRQKDQFLEAKQTFCDEGASVSSRRRLLQPPRTQPVLPRPFVFDWLNENMLCYF